MAITASSQNTIKVRVIDGETNEPLIGATASISPTKGAITDVDGYLEISGTTQDTITVLISYVGYRDLTRQITFPRTNEIIIFKLTRGEELEEVIVTSTRASRTIDAIPTRVEVLGSEELAEKAIMRSNNIAMVLRESTGIQMQITSASSANQSIRIQGLDGRYTQMLKDGFPLFGGFSGGLSIMQVPPLDLHQVEVIKGSNSTLFGGGAIAGLVNLVTYTPEQGRKLRFMLDQTQALGTTFNSFYANKFEKWGLSIFTSGNRQKAYDANDDDFSDIPRIRSLTINPSLFYYFNDRTKFRLTLNATVEDREGGDIEIIEEEGPGIYQFTERNQSDRYSYQLTYENRLSNRQVLRLKHSLTFFDREISEPNLTFAGRQWSTFSEVSYSSGSTKSSWVSGLNVYSDQFTEDVLVSEDRGYRYITLGGFTQNTSVLSDQVSLESGFRLDYDIDYGIFALPRLSLLAKLNEKWTARIGGGLGYKLPTIFTEEAESLTFESILPIDINNMDAERSFGGNFDINYKTAIGKNWTFSFNQLLFYTRLNESLVFRQNNQGQFFYENADGPVDSQGIETNMKVTFKDFKLFANYAFIDARLKFDNLIQQKALTPKHNFGAVLIFEQEDKWRIGFESYYTGRQFRSDRTKTDDFWIIGLMAMRKINMWSVYINFENFIDTRQHKLENFNITDHFKPQLPEIWAPTEGSIINAGLILDL